MKKRLIITSIISILLVIFLMIGSTYSVFVTSNVDEDLNVYKTGNLDVTYTLNEENITLTAKVPTSDDNVTEIKPYRITVTNTGNVAYKFNLILTDTTATDAINPQYIMTKVGKLEAKSLGDCIDNIIKEGIIIPANDSAIIDLRVYLSQNIKNSEIGKSFYAKLSIDGIAVYNDNDKIDNTVLESPSSIITTFNANGGEVEITEKEVKLTKEYGELPTPVRDEYIFLGWYTKETGGEKITSSSIVTATRNQTLYARWLLETYTLKLDYQNNIYEQETTMWTFQGSSNINNESDINGIELYSSSEPYTGIIIPLNADKKTNTNYEMSLRAYRNKTFSGDLRMYTTNSDSSIIVLNSNQGININTTNLPIDTWTKYSYEFNSGNYATWSNIYLNFSDANQGAVYVNDIRLDEIATSVVTVGETYGELPTPTRTGYTFKGWYTEEIGGEQVTSDSIVTGLETLYAHWIGNEYTITYRVGDGSNTSGVTGLGATTCTYGERCYLKSFSDLDGIFPYSAEDKTLTGNNNYGWSFAGWNTSYNGTNVNYSDGQSFIYHQNSNITLYALGKRKVKFYSGIAPTKELSTEIYQYWNPYSTDISYLTTITLPTPTGINGWTFVGYKVNNNIASGAVPYTSDAVGTSVPLAYDLYPIMNSVYSRPLTISYDSNGGTGITLSTIENQYYNSGSASNGTNNGDNISNPILVLAENGYSKTGYNFSAWAEDSTNGTRYSPGTEYTKFSLDISNVISAKNMYAIWSPKNFKITFNANGGSVSVSSKTVTYDSEYGTLPTPTRTGYTFNGWYTTASGGEQVTSTSIVSITSAQTLYASWTPITTN